MSDDGRLLVNFGALRTASADITRAISALQTQLGDLDRYAQPLVGTWEGTAQQAYAQRQLRWRQASADLTTVLQKIRKALDDSAEDYMHTEQRNARQFDA